MLAQPKYWQKYYEGSADEQRLSRAYSFSDRCRYYWPEPHMVAAVATLKAALTNKTIPLGVLKQFFPIAYEAVREGRLQAEFDALLHFHIQQALLPYYRATQPMDGMRNAQSTQSIQ